MANKSKIQNIKITSNGKKNKVNFHVTDSISFWSIPQSGVSVLNVYRSRQQKPIW